MEIQAQQMYSVDSATIGFVLSAWKTDTGGIVVQSIQYLNMVKVGLPYIFLEEFRQKLASEKKDDNEKKKNREHWMNLDDHIKQNNVQAVKYGLRE